MAGYYDGETADKCSKVAVQHQDFYTDLESRYQTKQQAQQDTVQQISSFKSTMEPKIAKHTASFEGVD